MSFDPCSRRFNPLNPLWMFPETETNGEEAFEAPDEYRFCSDEEVTNDAPGQDFDEALEQIASGGCWVCPLWGRSWRAMDPW